MELTVSLNKFQFCIKKCLKGLVYRGLADGWQYDVNFYWFIQIDLFSFYQGPERDRRFKFGLGGALWDCNGLFIPGSAVDRVASTMTTKKTELNGCDWLHEISITIRKTKQTEVPNER